MIGSHRTKPTVWINRRIKNKSSSLIWWEPHLLLLIVWSLRIFGNKKRRFWMSSWLKICIHEIQKGTYFLTRRISDTFQTVSFLSSSLDIQLNCVCCRGKGGAFFYGGQWHHLWDRGKATIVLESSGRSLELSHT